jgi:hypothetical protein
MQKEELCKQPKWRESGIEPKVKRKSGDPWSKGADYLNHCTPWLRLLLKSDRLTVAAAVGCIRPVTQERLAGFPNTEKS